MKKIVFIAFFSIIIDALQVGLSYAKANSKTPQPDKQALPIQEQKGKTPAIVNLYRPNYVLPYYYTGSPYQVIYFNATPNNQFIQNDEFKAQLSLQVPIVHHLVKNAPLSLNFAYTQLMYWQVYAKSQYFRETNYEPELFIENYFTPLVSGQIGLNHQSNGRGGILERSWNRAYLQGRYANDKMLINLRVWSLIGEADSSDIHNPDIAYFLGYGNLVIAHELFLGLKGSIELQNIESGMRRGFVQATLSYPILKSMSLYGQFFNGYGQSLIEYNHRTTSAGIGIVLNDWVS